MIAQIAQKAAMRATADDRRRYSITATTIVIASGVSRNVPLVSNPAPIATPSSASLANVGLPAYPAAAANSSAPIKIVSVSLETKLLNMTSSGRKQASAKEITREAGSVST